MALGLTVYLVNLLWAEQTALACPTMHAPQSGYLWGIQGTPQNSWVADGLSLTFYTGREEQASCSCKQHLPPNHWHTDAASEYPSLFPQVPAVRRLNRS